MVARLSEPAGSEEEAAIVEAHVAFAEDPELNSGVEERARELENPEAAVLAVGEGYAGVLAAMEDEYMAARADDVCDVASQIAAEVMSRAGTALRRSSRLWRRRRPSGLQPGPGTLAAFGSRSEEMAAESAALDGYRHAEVRTRDGRRVEVAANMSAPCIPRAKKLSKG